MRRWVNFGNISPIGINVPDGFATTGAAYRQFLSEYDLGSRLKGILSGFLGQRKFRAKEGKADAVGFAEHLVIMTAAIMRALYSNARRSDGSAVLLEQCLVRYSTGFALLAQ